MRNYFQRILRLKDLEVWDYMLDEDIYRMILVDENRPTVMQDYDCPHPDIEEDFRENLITVRVFSKINIKDEHIEALDQFAKQLTDHLALAHCHVIVSFETQDIDVALNKILKEKLDLEFDNIPLERFIRLNQN